MGPWFWLNIPLAAAFLLAWSGIPLWLVLRHPDTGPDGGSGSQRRDRAPGTGVTADRPAAPERQPIPADGRPAAHAGR